MTWTEVAEVTELEIDKPISVEVDGEPVLVVKTDAGVFALSDICSHAEVSLTEGTVADGRVECWLHGAQFDLATGAALCLPATKNIESYPVRIGNDVNPNAVEVSVN
jgi:nitrite reductase/ring-hydroxylating ferredoxin subunit